MEQHYHSLEKEMLDEFYSYVNQHSSDIWLHWNMRDINYGFPAIAHRYKVLGGEPKSIHESQLVDLSRLLLAIYGDNYISHRRLPSLVELNKISHKDFLDGKQEAEAFDNKEYVKLHQSTLRKVDVIAKIVERADDGSLKTQSSWIDICGNYFVAFFELITEHPVISGVIVLLGILGTIISIISFFFNR